MFEEDWEQGREDIPFQIHMLGKLMNHKII